VTPFYKKRKGMLLQTRKSARSSVIVMRGCCGSRAYGPIPLDAESWRETQLREENLLTGTQRNLFWRFFFLQAGVLLVLIVLEA
jgi:hypothetical protein